MYGLSLHYLGRLPYEWRPGAPTYQIRLALALLEVEREERAAAHEQRQAAAKASPRMRAARNLADRGAAALARLGW